MRRKPCKLCGMVGPTRESFIQLTRGTVTRVYFTSWCITCWIANANALEDVADGSTEGFPLENTSAGREAKDRVAKSIQGE